MRKRKLDLSETWTVRRMGKTFKVCAQDGSEMAKATFARYEDAREFADAANAMKIGVRIDKR